MKKRGIFSFFRSLILSLFLVLVLVLVLFKLFSGVEVFGKQDQKRVRNVFNSFFCFFLGSYFWYVILVPFPYFPTPRITPYPTNSPRTQTIIINTPHQFLLLLSFCLLFAFLFAFCFLFVCFLLLYSSPVSWPLECVSMAVVGVDFGNLGSRVAVAQNRGIDTLSNEVNNRTTPSLVQFGGLFSCFLFCFLVFFLPLSLFLSLFLSIH